VTAFCPTSAAVEVIPNVIDLSQYSTTDHNRQPASLIFTGPFCYEPNYHGFVWFQHHVCPLLATRHPELEVIATGDHGGRLIPNPARVTLTGYLPDVKPLLAQATCCIAPLLEAGGTRLKILEAMAMRTPVVATSKGAEGLKAIDGEHLLIADRPGEFANAVTMVLTNPALAQRLSENAHRLVQAEYDVQAVAEQFLDLVQHVSAVPAAPARLTA
jgi:glycosyltransferase involved in cell wall biosynthesis